MQPLFRQLLGLAPHLALLSTTTVAHASDTPVMTASGCSVITTWTHPKLTAQWTGACIDGLATGNGVLEWRVDGKFDGRYEGPVRAGKAHGRGILFFSNGGHYDGDFVDGARTGHGVALYPDGSRFEGRFLNDKRSGRGVLTLDNGDRYEGGYVNDLRSGHGVFTGMNGDRYEGNFIGGWPHGRGTGVIDGETFTGEWRYGCFRQNGELRARLFAGQENCSR